jgi:putative transposase
VLLNLQDTTETFTFYQLPREHHNHLKGTNMLERINQELKRRTHVIRIFPNQESCLRLIRALAVEIHEDWIEGPRYLNMEMLRQQRTQLQLLEAVLR